MQKAMTFALENIPENSSESEKAVKELVKIVKKETVKVVVMKQIMSLKEKVIMIVQMIYASERRYYSDEESDISYAESEQSMGNESNEIEEEDQIRFKYFCL